MDEAVRRVVTIEIELLEKALQTNPALFIEWNEKAVAAEEALTLAKNNMDWARAGIEIELRNDPLKYHISKITEKAVDMFVVASPDYRKLVTEYAKKKAEYAILSGVVSAIRFRQGSLEELSQLKLGKPSNRRMI